MQIKARQTKLESILPLRNLFLQETNFQIRYNACHERGWTDSYVLTIDGAEVGYGSVNGQEIKERDTIFEFYVIPPFRKHASFLFAELIATSGVPLIECQSNDALLSAMLYEFAKNISSDVVLFGDRTITGHHNPSVVFRRTKKGEEHPFGEIGEYVLEQEGAVVATGGFLLHYNMPFADLYMEVREDHRRKGLGSFILQEVKKECYLAGRTPAARCNIENPASRATLLKAGMRICGFMLRGEVNKRNGPQLTVDTSGFVIPK